MHGLVGGHRGMQWRVAASLLLHGAALAMLVDAGQRRMPAATVESGLDVLLVAEIPAVLPPMPAMLPPIAAPAPALAAAPQDPEPAAPEPQTPRPVPAPPAPVAGAGPRALPAGSANTPRAAPALPVPPGTALPAPPAPDVDAAARAWRAALLAWVQAHKEYPRAARLRGIEGVVAVRVTVAADGLVGAVEVTDGSGSEVLDAAVRRMLEGAQVPPFPPGLARTAREETLRVGFTLR